MPAFAQKCLSAHKSASSKHKNVCPHSQMPLQPQTCLSLFRKPSSEHKNALCPTNISRKIHVGIQKCFANTNKCLFCNGMRLVLSKNLVKKSAHLHSRMTVSTKNNSFKYKNVSPALKMSFGTTKYRSMHQNPF